MVKAGGAGPIIHAKASISGSELGWGFVINLMSCISNVSNQSSNSTHASDSSSLSPQMATLITNATDFASRSSRPKNVIIPQLVALPVTFA